MSTHFVEAEVALDRSGVKAEATEMWTLSPTDFQFVEPLLAAYDRQIATVSTKVYMDAVMQVGRLLAASNITSLVARFKVKMVSQ